MSALFGPIPPRVLVQGITGGEGSHWTERMLAGGTNIVAGCTPGKGGDTVHGVPVYDAVAEACGEHAVEVALNFVPARFAAAAAIEAIEAGVATSVVLAEFVPVHDTMRLLATATDAGATIIGPNCPGMVFPGRDFIGIMPGWSEQLFAPGRVGVVSRSGSLGALVNLHVVEAGLGQSGFLGLGGDPLVGTTFADALRWFEADSGTDAIVLLGEIGGLMEEAAAEMLDEISKPVIAFIAGQSAPQGKKMGHAGALISGGAGSAASKMEALAAAGAVVADAPAGVPKLVAASLSERD